MTDLTNEPAANTTAAANAGSDDQTAIRTCPLCEAGCGLAIEHDGTSVRRIRGDRLDVFSHGFLCPKGTTLGHLHDDPDRLRQPLVRRDGELVPVGWDEAWAAVADGLGSVIERHGRSALGAYVGNPNAHNLGALLYLKPLLKALGTANVFSASTVDQRPKELSAGLMFGTPLSVPVPDLDRTDYLLMLGANPYASNGSLATAPDWPGRLDALVERGGRLVVVDPRRTRTAEAATEHLAIRPGADALFLAAIVNTLNVDGRIDCGAAAPYVAGLDEALAALAPCTPEAVAAATGIDAETTRRIAHELADAPTAAVYGRIGTTTAPFGTVTSWLVDICNLVTGNLDRPGGAMFTCPATGSATTRGPGRIGRGMTLGSHRSRVRGLPATMGELPAVCMAEEITTSGEGQIRAMVIVAGNPVLSLPDSDAVDAALGELDFLVAVDIYRNETTRHADVVLPAPSALQKSHYDVALLQLAIRNVANYSPPVFALDDGAPDEWEILARLALIAQGAGVDAPPSIIDDMMIGGLVSAAVSDDHGPVAGRDEPELLAALEPRVGPERLLDFMLRTGPYGDAFGARPDGLSLAALEAHPHGIDLGPLQPRLPDVLRTPDGMIDAAPEAIVADVVDRLIPGLSAASGDGDGGAGDGDGDGAQELVLIGRRHLRSNNSWMHNVRVLVKGKDRCTLQVHPDDAAARGLVDGGVATVRSASGSLSAPVEVTDAIRPGVVSLPHGWGHDTDGAALSVAETVAGVNVNRVVDPAIDVVSGTAVLNGTPVVVTALAPAAVATDG